MRADRYAAAAAGSVDPWKLNGFTAFPGHEIGGPDPPPPDTSSTNGAVIWLSRSLWGDTAAIGHWSLHEYGHIVYYDHLTVDKQAAWQGLWSAAKARGELPSAYAAISEYEGFAEAFAAYVGGAKLDPALRDWFDQIPR